MLIWNLPRESGDYELRQHPDEKERSLLTVVDPTPRELVELRAFLMWCMAEEHCPRSTRICETGKTEVVMACPLPIAGAKLLEAAQSAMPDRGILTVVRSFDGRVLGTADDVEGSDAHASAAAELASREEAAAAVTVKKPTHCCPLSLEGPITRAGKVLRRWCSARQWQDWITHGWVDVVGGVTGHLYRVHHRSHPMAQYHGKMMVDLDLRNPQHPRGTPIHAWDWRVPPEEEVLSMMLLARHREPWIRNASTVLTFGSTEDRDLLHNPHDDQRLSGTWDSTLYRSFGIGTAIGLQLRSSNGVERMRSMHAILAAFRGDVGALLTEGGPS